MFYGISSQIAKVRQFGLATTTMATFIFFQKCPKKDSETNQSEFASRWQEGLPGMCSSYVPFLARLQVNPPPQKKTQLVLQLGPVITSKAQVLWPQPWQARQLCDQSRPQPFGHQGEVVEPQHHS